MKITAVRSTPLFVPNKAPCHWTHGVTYGATVILIEIETDEGVTGIGECIGTPFFWFCSR